MFETIQESIHKTLSFINSKFQKEPSIDSIAKLRASTVLYPDVMVLKAMPNDSSVQDYVTAINQTFTGIVSADETVKAVPVEQIANQELKFSFSNTRIVCDGTENCRTALKDIRENIMEKVRILKQNTKLKQDFEVEQKRLNGTIAESILNTMSFHGFPLAREDDVLYINFYGDQTLGTSSKPCLQHHYGSLEFLPRINKPYSPITRVYISNYADLDVFDIKKTVNGTDLFLHNPSYYYTKSDFTI